MRKVSSRARRMTGWLLSALALTVYFSPQAQLLRTLPSTLSVAAGQGAQISAPFPLKVEVASAEAASSTAETLAESKNATATISLLGLLPLREVNIEISDDLRLCPGGQAVCREWDTVRPEAPGPSGVHRRSG